MEPSFKSTSRFSDRVENYVRYRPTYPGEIIGFLGNAIGLTPAHVVADIGSGTGISTELFLRNGNHVYAVEPNNDMRAKAEDLLHSYPRFVSISGTAEQTTLKDSSIDVIIAGQAFHWFDPVKTKTEFRRIARAGAWTVLLWNERQVVSDFEKAYEAFVLRHATDYTSVDHRNITQEALTSFFAPNPFTLKTFPNQQTFDFAGLKGRLLSSSYIPNEHQPGSQEMIAELHRMFEGFQTYQTVRFDYVTTVYFGRAK